MKKYLIAIDIQPEYEKWINFDVSSMIYWAEDQNYSDILVLFNGEDLGMISGPELYNWYLEKVDYDKELEFLKGLFFEKGYGFFRNCMDEGFAEEVIVPLVRYMHKNNITDSRDIDYDELPILLDKKFKSFISETPEVIFIPSLMSLLKDIPRSSEIHLIGGARKECLKEVEIALQALNFKYYLINEFIY